MSDRRRHYDLFNNIPSGVAVYEARDNGNDFVFVDFNHSAEKIEGIERKDLIGKSIKAFFPEVEEFGIFKVLQEVWKTGIEQHHPVSLYKDGRIQGWRENYVYKLPDEKIVAVYNDVTPLQEKEAALQTRQAQLNTLINFSEDMYILKDEKGIYKMVNPAFCRFLGRVEHEIIGKTDHDLFPAAEADRFRQDDKRIMESGVPLTQDEEVSGEGELTSWLQVKKVPVVNEKGQSLGVLCSVRDISERKRIEDALRANEAMLKRAHAELANRVQERTEELEEANIALKVLLQHRGKEKNEVEERINASVHEFVFPYLEKIQKTDSLRMVDLHVNSLRKVLEEIAKPFAKNIIEKDLRLTPREIQVAALVRHGRTTQEIAEMMGLSRRTIETYRDNLRQKFDIKNQNTNLRSCLLSFGLAANDM